MTATGVPTCMMGVAAGESLAFAWRSRPPLAMSSSTASPKLAAFESRLK